MRKWLLASIAVGLILAAVRLSAYELDILNSKKFTFVNKKCEKTNSCSLKQIHYSVENYRILIHRDYNYGTRLFASYRTDSVNTLEDFVFVQFIKGCMYLTRLEDGKVVPGFSIARYYFNEIVQFKTADSSIDSIDLDPAYNSIPELNRHYAYRWNMIRGSFDENSEKYYGVERPVFPELYISDRVGQAFYYDSLAKNVSLKFKVCLYKAGNVPFKAKPEDVQFAEPIHCYDWSSSFVYNHKKMKFERPKEISPFCQ